MRILCGLVIASLCASLSLNAAARVNAICSNKLVPFQTEFVKQLIKNPVEIYAEFYRLDQESLKTNDPHNIPVRKFFHEEIPLLREHLAQQMEYFQSIDYKDAIQIVAKLQSEVESFDKNEFGLLDYNVVVDEVLLIRDWIQMVDARWEALKEKYTYSRAQEELFKYENDHFKRLSGDRSQNRKQVLLRMYQFPFFPIATKSDTSRLELVRIQAAPFWIKRIALEDEYVDEVLRSPRGNANHDKSHAESIAIELDKVSAMAATRFKDWDAFYIFLKRKDAVTKYIVDKVQSEKHPIWQLRLVALLFHFCHEQIRSSIEYLSDSYQILLFDSLRARVNERYFRYFFLHELEQKILQSGNRRSWLHPWTQTENEKAVKQLKQWYKEGNGPEWSVIDGDSI